MKRLRLLVYAAGAVVLLAVAALAVAFNSSFQTWAARKALAAQEGMNASVGSVSAGLSRVEVRDLRIEKDGVVLLAPAISAELPVLSAAVRNKVAISRLVAKGWTVAFPREMASPSAAPATAASPGSPPSASPAATTPTRATPATETFSGVFARLELPVQLSVDGLQLEGDVVLPEARGRVKLLLAGGGLAATREGKFDLSAAAALADPAINAAEVRGEVIVAMETSRTFSKISARLTASARGTQFPEGVMVTADVSAARAGGAETYSAGLVNAAGEIVTVKAEYPGGGARLAGTWKVDVRDADVAPFALGHPLPAFTAVGDGAFDTDASFSRRHVSGRLNATVDRLHVLAAELAAVGELKITSEFDLAERNGVVAVQKFEAAITAAEPVATVRALQPFEFNRQSAEFRASEAARELLGVVLHGVPLAWAKPLLKELELQGGPLRGEFVATPRGGGVAVRSTKALAASGVRLGGSGKPLLRDVDFATNVSADYTPQGWQAEVVGLSARSGDATLLTIDAKAGQLAGREQPLKTTGRAVADVPGWLLQPVAEGSAVLTAGSGTLDFVASVNAKTELQATLALKNLATVVDKEAVKLPSVAADVRADIAPDGKITFNVPVVLERNERKSDLTLTGTAGPEKDKSRAIEAQISSTKLVVEDAQVFAGVVAERPPEEPGTSAKPKESVPPWAGLHGSVALHLKRVIYSDTFEVTELGGRLRIDGGMLKLEGLQAGLGENGRAQVNGSITFNGSVPQAYGLAADVRVKDFDPGPLFRAVNKAQPPTIEGRFDITSRLAAKAPTLGALARGAGGEFQLTSKGGVFRGLPLDVGNLVESSSKLATWIASAGTAIGAMTGRKDYNEIANKAQAAAELAKGLHPIVYDQLSLVLSRDAALNATLKDFTLIAPEVRLTGGGTVLHRPGFGLLDNSLAMEFKLRARGRQADLLKFLGVLEPEADALGYAACTIPLRISGTLSKPDTSEINGRLAALALERSGVTEKASELLNKVFGGGK